MRRAIVVFGFMLTMATVINSAHARHPSSIILHYRIESEKKFQYSTPLDYSMGLTDMIREAGFKNARFEEYTLGAALCYIAEK